MKTPKIPINLEECLNILKSQLIEEDIKVLKDTTSLKSFTASTHFGYGMFLRNNWSLWDKKSVLVKWFKKELGIDHADDISNLILTALYKDIRGEPRNDKAVANSCIKYWKKMEDFEKRGINRFHFSITCNEDGGFDIGEIEEGAGV